MKDKVYDTLMKRVEPFKHKEERRIKDKDLIKTYDMVFDTRTMMTIYHLINTGKIETVDFPISTGKEAVVFRASTVEGSYYALKVYMVSTSVFKTMDRYIQGDPRFKGIHRRRKDKIYTWASKEFKNLQRFYKEDIRVPMPFHQRKNTLVMEYIGNEDGSAPTMKDLITALKRAGENVRDIASGFASVILGYVKDMVTKAKLVHSDLSEFNVLVMPDNGTYELVLIDVGQSVVLDHPESYQFFKRDMGNIARYFRSLKVDIEEEWEETYSKCEPEFGLEGVELHG